MGTDNLTDEGRANGTTEVDRVQIKQAVAEYADLLQTIQAMMGEGIILRAIA